METCRFASTLEKRSPRNHGGDSFWRLLYNLRPDSIEQLSKGLKNHEASTS